jgi:23S rRNA pseudouridine955/2504/2580 synthase
VKHIIDGNPSALIPQVNPKVKSLEVDEESAGQRLDNFLMRHLKGVPKTHVYRIIRSGEVRVNKGRASADTRIKIGDLVRLPPVRLSDRVAEKAQAMAEGAAQVGVKGGPSREFPILFEDEAMLAIDKPAGVAVHGGSGVSFGVIEQLRMARPEAKFLELVHRLDRDTSGILLLAKKRSALKALQDQFRERETGKTYLAVVVGQWPTNKKVLDKPLHKYLLPDGERRVKVVARDDPDGMKSVTLVKVKQHLPVSPEWEKGLAGLPKPPNHFSLLEVTIKTGRTHQIRVHLASEGFPIAGDDKYGDFELNKALQKVSFKTTTMGASLKRMFLHAWRLQFSHPLSGERIELLSPLPPELEQFLTHVDP